MWASSNSQQIMNNYSLVRVDATFLEEDSVIILIKTKYLSKINTQYLYDHF